MILLPDLAGGLLNSKAAVQALAEAAGHPLRYVLLFGGEPFLAYSLLLELARESKRLTGAPVTVFTNAFWAASRRHALTLLKPLAEAGASRLYLSLDSYHADYVPPGRVATAALAADQLGLEVFADAAILPGLSDGDPEARRTRAITCKFERETGIRVTEKPFAGTGRAAALPDGPPEDLSVCRLPSYLGSRWPHRGGWKYTQAARFASAPGSPSGA